MGSKAQQTETDQVSTELDLEMLAPYISMEEDFQLSSFESPEEKDGRACSDQRLDTDPKDRPTTQDGSRGLSEALTVPETGDTTAFRPQPSSLHAIQSSKPASSQGEALYRSLRGALRPQGGAAASQRSSNMTRLSVGRAPGSSSKSMAFGGPAFTAAVENVLLALFQPQTSASPPETGIHIGQSARTNGQDADSLKSGAELEPSAQLDSAGTESAVPAEPSRERALDTWAFEKDQEELSPRVWTLHNLKRKHSLHNGNLQDSLLDVSSVADIVRVTAKRLKKTENSKTSPERKPLTPATPMTLTMQLLEKEMSGPPELTRYVSEVNAPLTDRHRLLQGAELLKALHQVS